MPTRMIKPMMKAPQPARTLEITKFQGKITKWASKLIMSSRHALSWWLRKNRLLPFQSQRLFAGKTLTKKRGQLRAFRSIPLGDISKAMLQLLRWLLLLATFTTVTSLKSTKTVQKIQWYFSMRQQSVTVMVAPGLSQNICRCARTI